MIDFLRWLLSPIVTKLVKEEQEKTMAEIDTLKARVDALQESISSIISTVQELYAKVGPLTISQQQLEAINPELAKLSEILRIETEKLDSALFPPTEPPTP